MPIIPTLPSDQGWAAAHSTRSCMSLRSWASMKLKVPSEPPGPADVGDHVNVAARDEEVARPGFDESHRCAEVLNLPWVRRSCDQHGIRALRLRPVDVRQQPGPITHWYLDVVIAHEGVGGLGEIPVLTTGCLRPVQLPLTWGSPGYPRKDVAHNALPLSARLI